MTIVIEEKEYKIEFDNNAYAVLENNTGKSVFTIFDNFLAGAPQIGETIETIYCGLLKHHGEEEAQRVKDEVSDKKYLIMNNLKNIAIAFIKPLTPPEVLQKQDAKSSKKKRNLTGTKVPM